MAMDSLHTTYQDNMANQTTTIQITTNITTTTKIKPKLSINKSGNNEVGDNNDHQDHK